MADLKKTTVKSLRELVRKTLGPGPARLKTKGELIRALEEAGAGARPTRVPGKQPSSAGGKAMSAAKGAGKAAGARAVARSGKAAVDTAAGAREAVKIAKTARARKPGKVSAAAAVAGAAAGAAAAARSRRSPPAEGDPEGFFVARVRGEEAVREAPHPMGEIAREELRTPPPPLPRPRYDEGLGELPWRYGDDAFVAMARDPRSMFLYWDHADGTVAAALSGLDSPRTQLWILVRAAGGWDRIRTIDFALESRSYYVHELEPGRTYRAEVHVVDQHGNERRIAQPSNEVSLPPIGPSPIVDDRFIRIPWGVQLGSALGPGHPGVPFSDEARALLARLSDWARFARSASPGAGGIGGRPGSPSSPFGPYAQGER